MDVSVQSGNLSSTDLDAQDSNRKDTAAHANNMKYNNDSTQNFFNINVSTTLGRATLKQTLTHAALVGSFAIAGGAFRMLLLELLDGVHLNSVLPSKVAVPNCLGCFIMGFTNYYLPLATCMPITRQAVTIGNNDREEIRVRG